MLYFDAKMVARFFDAHTTVDPETRQRWVNGVMADRRDSSTVARWRTESDRASLTTVDAMLMKYDLMLWEFEQWCEDLGLDPELQGAR